MAWSNLSSPYRAAFAAVAIGVLLLIGPTGFAHAAQTISIKITPRIQYERPEFPIPHDKNQLFFLQRSMNSNTIVYTANFDAYGRLDRKEPIEIFWRRFNNEGQRAELGHLERFLAFGLKTRWMEKDGVFEVEFNALPGRVMTLAQDDQGRVYLYGYIGDRKVRPVYIYVDLDDSSLVPRVQYLYLHGIDLETSSALVETVEVSGGNPED